MKRIALVLMLVPLFSSILVADADITINRVVGPEIPGRYKHPATVTELANGDLYIAYYGGEGEYEGDTAVYGLRLPKGGSEWTRPSNRLALTSVGRPPFVPTTIVRMTWSNEYLE